MMMYILTLANHDTEIVVIHYHKFDTALWRGRYQQKRLYEEWKIRRESDNVIIAQSYTRADTKRTQGNS